jgi:hypothetical protein
MMLPPFSSPLTELPPGMSLRDDGSPRALFASPGWEHPHAAQQTTPLAGARAAAGRFEITDDDDEYAAVQARAEVCALPPTPASPRCALCALCAQDVPAGWARRSTGSGSGSGSTTTSGAGSTSSAAALPPPPPPENWLVALAASSCGSGASSGSAASSAARATPPSTAAVIVAAAENVPSPSPACSSCGSAPPSSAGRHVTANPLYLPWPHTNAEGASGSGSASGDSSLFSPPLRSESVAAEEDDSLRALRASERQVAAAAAALADAHATAGRAAAALRDAAEERCARLAAKAAEAERFAARAVRGAEALAAQNAALHARVTELTVALHAATQPPAQVRRAASASSMRLRMPPSSFVGGVRDCSAPAARALTRSRPDRPRRRRWSARRAPTRRRRSPVMRRKRCVHAVRALMRKSCEASRTPKGEVKSRLRCIGAQDAAELRVLRQLVGLQRMQLAAQQAGGVGTTPAAAAADAAAMMTVTTTPPAPEGAPATQPPTQRRAASQVLPAAPPPWPMPPMEAAALTRALS